jgi:hypothetical protein
LSDDEFNFDNVLNELLAKEARLKLFDNSFARNTVNFDSKINKEIALHSFNKSNSVKSKSQYKQKCKSFDVPVKTVNPNFNVKTKNETRKCFKCGLPNHLASNCRNVKTNLKGKQSDVDFVTEAYYYTDISKTAFLFDTAASSHFLFT